MLKDGKIFAGVSDKELYLLPQMANRHGLIAGATGTGKTITMKVLAESFSDLGVPVFFSDVKGDLSGMCEPGADSADMQERIDRFGIRDTFQYKSYPVRFWDIFGEQGHPVRVTVSGLGPVLLARLLNLTEVQAGVLNIVFKVADDQGLLLLDLKDLRAMLQYVAENREEYTVMYGNIAMASVGAIQRALLAFEQEGGEGVFGEPELEITDWIRTDAFGRGYINILSSTKLIQSPLVYSTFLLWMLTELYEKLPEVGDLDKPRVVFFFDEAHFLFTDTPKALVAKIEQVIKLIRSKGVGVYFVTQNPTDIPDSVLAQLSNRIQHGLRAYTPSEQRSIRAAANAFRENPAFNTEDALAALGTGDALVSFLDEDGIPSIVENAKILPPQSLMGPAPADKVTMAINASEFDLKYRNTVDRESAYEIIERAKASLYQQPELPEEIEETVPEAAMPETGLTAPAAAGAVTAAAAASAAPANKTEEFMAKKKSGQQSTLEKAAKSAVRNASSTVTRAVSSNIVNALTGGKTTSAKTVAKRTATNALSAAMRTGANSLLRGIFGNLK